MDDADTKQNILEAAGRIVLARGASGLTLAAVAQEAGLSKGGLLYHYASKEQLLSAMVERLVEVTEQRVAAQQCSDAAPGRWTRGYLAACAVDTDAADDPAGRLGIALLAAGANDPSLLAPLRERQANWRGELQRDGIDATTAMIVRLAADGLWMNDLFGLAVLGDEQRASVLARLHRMTEP
jgi:AcrR family transcriptional regulator